MPFKKSSKPRECVSFRWKHVLTCTEGTFLIVHLHRYTGCLHTFRILEYSYSSVWILLEDELDSSGIHCTWMCHEAMCVGQVEASCPYSTLKLHWYLFGFLWFLERVHLTACPWKAVIHHHSHFQRYESHLKVVCDFCLLWHGRAVIPTRQILSCSQPSKTLGLDQWRRPVMSILAPQTTTQICFSIPQTQGIYRASHGLPVMSLCGRKPLHYIMFVCISFAPLVCYYYVTPNKNNRYT